MIKRKRTGRLSVYQDNYCFENHEDINPMSGLANMADAMLVLAVGIMIAVVLGWKLDLKALNGDARIKTISSEEIETVDPETLDADQNALEELGTLLYDKESGTY